MVPAEAGIVSPDGYIDGYILPSMVGTVGAETATLVFIAFEAGTVIVMGENADIELEIGTLIEELGLYPAAETPEDGTIEISG